VLEVVAQELFEMSAVPDEGAVAEFAAHGADPVGAENSSGYVDLGFRAGLIGVI
jgi:hypothetical protein